MTKTEHHRVGLYIDVEMAFWSGPPPPGLKQEVIEIGIVEMDLLSLAIKREAAYFVRPRRWEISDKCTKLTGITNEDIRTARPFREVIEVVSESFRPAEKLCGTWGDDQIVITQACQQVGLRNPLRNVLDVGQLFRSAFLLKDQASLSNAIKLLDLEFEGTPHGALSDAKNTANVHAAIIRRMRRQPDPPRSSIEESSPQRSTSYFAQKLKECL